MWLDIDRVYRLAHAAYGLPNVMIQVQPLHYGSNRYWKVYHSLLGR